MKIKKSIYEINGQAYDSLEKIPPEYQSIFKNLNNFPQNQLSVAVKTQRLGNEPIKTRYYVNRKKYSEIEKMPAWAKTRIEELTKDLTSKEAPQEIKISNQVLDLTSDLVTSIAVYAFCSLGSISFIWEIQNALLKSIYGEMIGNVLLKFLLLLINLVTGYFGYRLALYFFNRENLNNPHGFSRTSFSGKLLFGFYVMTCTFAVGVLMTTIFLSIYTFLPNSRR